ncbi:diguanylate cyclase [Salipaludibacillus sp. HK11]|uniref:diguanylate cyclase n=1 Tax=Salipaludibacillus sp. HK11 TaxID=3394320 RepID=UPI0039FC556D
MKNDRRFIHKRNRLVLQLLFFFNLFRLGAEVIFYDNVSIFAIVGFVLIAIVWFISQNSQAKFFTMYATITIFYGYMFYMLIEYPQPSTYLFVWLGLIISSIYNKVHLIVLATIYTLLLTSYVYYQSALEVIFFSQSINFIYFLLFTLFVAMFLVVQTKFSEKMWNGLKESQEKLTYILESANIVTYSYNLKTEVHTVTSGVVKLKNISRKEFSASPILWREFIHVEDEMFVNGIEEDIQQGKKKSVEYRLQIPDNPMMWVSARFFPILNDQGSVVRVEGALVDISDRKKAEEKIEFLAYHDPLTKLPNRSLLYEFVEQKQVCPKFNYKRAFIIFIDLDSFKQVNDTYGHAAGDQLLSIAAKRLTSSLKKIDIVSRIGGDEFVVFVDKLSVEQAVKVAERLKVDLCSPFIIGGEEIKITPSIGISKFSSTSDNLDTLISQADTAMYNIKNEGKNGVKLYDYVH